MLFIKSGQGIESFNSENNFVCKDGDRIFESDINNQYVLSFDNFKTAFDAAKKIFGDITKFGIYHD